jgi:hypothetical protein
MTRAHIPLKTKLAAALCVVFQIPHDHAEAMSADEVLSLAHWDHYPVPKAENGSDHHSNLYPRLIHEHRARTAAIDLPGIAKRKRVSRAHSHHQAVMASKATGDETPAAARRGRKIQSRGFQQGHRPLRSRNNLRRRG